MTIAVKKRYPLRVLAFDSLLIVNRQPRPNLKSLVTTGLQNKKNERFVKCLNWKF